MQNIFKVSWSDCHLCVCIDLPETLRRWLAGVMAHEINRQVSTSDDDSVSLLCNLDVCQIRGAAEDMEVGASDVPVRNEGQKKELEVEVNQIQAPESGIPSCTQSTSQLGNCNLDFNTWNDVCESVLLPAR